MTFKLLGGSARLLGQYSAVYKTKREGQFELILEHFHLSVPVQRNGLTKFVSLPFGHFDKYLNTLTLIPQGISECLILINKLQTPSPDACTLEVDEAMVTLSPVLPEQISTKIKADLMDQLRNAACFQATSFFSKLNSQLLHFAEATDISQGSHPSHIDVDLVLQNASPDDDSAVRVAVSESVVNAEISKLYSTANTRFLWNDVPEIKGLLEKCTSSECRFIEDRDIQSSFFDRPSLKIHSDDTVALRLPLSTTLTTSAKKELFRIQSDIHLILEDIVVEHPENGLVSWSAKFRVKDIKILQTASSRNFQKFASTIESWIQENKGFIEVSIASNPSVSDNFFFQNLLNSYLHGSLPVHLRSPLSWSHRLHARPNYSTSSLHFQVHPHFVPSLRVLV